MMKMREVPLQVVARASVPARWAASDGRPTNFHHVLDNHKGLKQLRARASSEQSSEARNLFKTAL